MAQIVLASTDLRNPPSDLKLPVPSAAVGFRLAAYSWLSVIEGSLCECTAREITTVMLDRRAVYDTGWGSRDTTAWRGKPQTLVSDIRLPLWGEQTTCASLLVPCTKNRYEVSGWRWIGWCIFGDRCQTDGIVVRSGIFREELRSWVGATTCGLLWGTWRDDFQFQINRAYRCWQIQHHACRRRSIRVEVARGNIPENPRERFFLQRCVSVCVRISWSRYSNFVKKQTHITSQGCANWLLLFELSICIKYE